MHRPFHNKSVLARLYSSEAGSTFASQYVLFALPVVAVTVIGASDFEVGLINAAAGFGVLVFLLVLGPLADLRRKDLLLGFMSLGRALIAAVLTYGFMADLVTVPVLALAMFLLGGVTALYESSVSAYIPNLVDKRELPTANSWIAGLRSAADIGAGAAAGWILQFMGSAWLAGVVAVIYCVVALGPFSMRRIFKSRTGTTPPETDSDFTLKTAFSGFGILFGDPAQLRMNLSIAQFNLFTAGIQAIYAVYAIRYADLNAFTFGLAGAIGGLVGLSGVWISSWAIRRFPARPLFALTLAVPAFAGIFIVFLPFYPPPLQVVVLGTCLGVWAAATLTNVALFETLKQVLVSPTHLGRYSAASRLLTWGVDPFGALLAAFAVTVLPIGTVLTVAVVGLALSSCWIWRSRHLLRLSVDGPAPAPSHDDPVKEPK